VRGRRIDEDAALLSADMMLVPVPPDGYGSVADGCRRIEGGSGPSFTTMRGLAGAEATSTLWLFERRCSLSGPRGIVS